MDTGKKLDFLVIGAQKCATSWLYYCLKEHPELHLPKDKLEKEYLGGDLYEQKGVDWYFSLFGGAAPKQLAGDVSVQYMFDTRALDPLAQYAPNVQLIASLRNPAERLHSAYYWYLRKGLVTDAISLDEGLQQLADAKFDSAKHPQLAPFQEMIDRGLYDVQLQRYVERFGKDKLMVLLYEDIQDRPMQVVKAMYEFLGIDATYGPAGINKTPKRNSYFKPLIYLERLSPKSRIISGITNIANQALPRMGFTGKKQQFSPSTQKLLTQVFSPHIKATQTLVDQLKPEQKTKSASDLSRLWKI